MTRRTLLKAGFAGGAALFLARWLYTQSAPPTLPEAGSVALDARTRAIVDAIVPVLLDGTLPAAPEAGAARADVVANVDLAIAGLLPEARK
jgi:hypothetical protein